MAHDLMAIFGAVLIVFGVTLLVLVDAPRWMLSRIVALGGSLRGTSGARPVANANGASSGRPGQFSLAAYRGLAPGWYRDSSNRALARYWDGVALSSQTAPHRCAPTTDHGRPAPTTDHGRPAPTTGYGRPTTVAVSRASARLVPRRSQSRDGALLERHGVGRRAAPRGDLIWGTTDTVIGARIRGSASCRPFVPKVCFPGCRRLWQVGRTGAPRRISRNRRVPKNKRNVAPSSCSGREGLRARPVHGQMERWLRGCRDLS